MAQLGQMALLCALVTAAYGLVAAGVGASRRFPEFVESARHAAYGVAALATVASGLLVFAFVSHDFSLKYVAENSTRDAPLSVALTGFWGGQAGSLLFWAWGLTLLAAAVAWIEFHRHRALIPATLGALFAIQLFFLGVLGFVAGPFEQLATPPPDGRGLNPLLWDDGMRIHPPLLLAGYMSFSAPFAFAIAALLTGRLAREWLAPVRRWMVFAWAVQGTGLLAGAWWAYHVLGWGGYWGWDPVENAALMPWLVATAFLHSIMVQERRGLLKTWNLGLVIATFALAIFGTFVVRSGVLSSVHSFAQSAIGPYFLAFLGVVLVLSLGLLFFRLAHLAPEGEFDSVVSREAAFLLNNLLLVAAAVATFWGTIFPLVSEVVRGVKISVGAPFYQFVNGPLLIALVVLMGVGPLVAWRRTSLASLWRNLRWPVLVAVAVTAVLFVLGIREGMAALASAATTFTLGTIVLEYWRGVRVRRRTTGEPLPVALVRLVGRARRRYGGYLVHLAVVLAAFGVIGSSYYQVERTGTLAPGESMTVGRYTFTYGGLYERPAPGVQTIFARLAVRNDTADLGEMRPERRIYRNWEQQPITGVAYRTVGPWLDDLYVLLTGWEEGNVASFRVFVNPLVSLIWAGGALFLLGTLIAAWPERARVARVHVPAARPIVSPAAPAAQAREVVAGEV
ncbi:MAG: heme lyase CcmF/NrfE family subunit [Chloroflexi bacterium]|nr:heme lyase CcmF/NrfE family subunit [Chloroflexota bacterium]